MSNDTDDPAVFARRLFPTLTATPSGLPADPIDEAAGMRAFAHHLFTPAPTEGDNA